MRFARESESPVVPRASQESINLREERGNTFVTFLNEGRNEGVCDKNIDKVDKVPYLSYNLIAY